MSSLTRDGTAGLVSRDQFSGANGDRKKSIFPVQLTTTSRIDNLLLPGKCTICYNKGHSRLHKKKWKAWKILQTFQNFPPFKIWKVGKFGKHACTIATPLGYTYRQGNKDSLAQVSSEGSGILDPRWLLCAPLLANEVGSRIYGGGIGIFFLGGFCGPQNPKVFKVFQDISYYLKRGFTFPSLYLNC